MLPSDNFVLGNNKHDPGDHTTLKLAQSDKGSCINGRNNIGLLI